jgi:bacterioferritin (cytochrome b1)
MAEIRRAIAEKLNAALEWEEGKNAVYGVLMVGIRGPNAEPIYQRFKEIVEATQKHAAKLRVLVVMYLGEAATTKVRDMPSREGLHSVGDIIGYVAENEEKAVKAYHEIYALINDRARGAREALPYAWERVEHDIRHILIDKEETIARLNTLLSRPPKFE